MRQGRADEAWLDDKVRRLLAVFERTGALDDPAEDVEHPEDRAEVRVVARRAAAEAMVLLKNEGGILPLVPSSLHRIGLIGPAAETLAIMGGGSAHVVPHYTLSLVEVLGQRLGPRFRSDIGTGRPVGHRPRGARPRCQIRRHCPGG